MRKAPLVDISREIGRRISWDPGFFIKKRINLLLNQLYELYIVHVSCRISTVDRAERHPTGGYGGTELAVEETRGSTSPWGTTMPQSQRSSMATSRWRDWHRIRGLGEIFAIGGCGRSVEQPFFSAMWFQILTQEWIDYYIPPPLFSQDLLACAPPLFVMWYQ